MLQIAVVCNVKSAKNFPLSPFVCFQQFSVALIAIKKNPRPYGRGYIFYINCSKYFSLNPVSGNLKELGFPSVDV